MQQSLPLLGDVWSGRAAFLPVLALGAVALAEVRRHVPESRAPGTLHRGGVVLNLAFVLGVFVLFFLVVTNALRSGESLLAVAGGTLLLVLAEVLREVARRSPHGIMVEIYGGRDLGMAILAGLMLMFAQGSFFYQIYPYFHEVQQVGAVAIVARYVPYVVGLLAGGFLAARASLRFRPRLILAASFLLMGAALFGLSALAVDSSYWAMVMPITLIGLAAGLGGPARAMVVMSGRPRGIVNGSAAINTAAGQVGYALGVIVSSVLVTQHADALFVDGLRTAGISSDIVSKVASALESPSVRLMASRYPELPEVIEKLTSVSYANAFTTGMTRMFFLVATMMAVTAAVIMVGMRRTPEAHS